MSRFLLLNFQDYSLGHRITETIQSHTLFCICCLQKNVPLLNLSSCKHAKYLDNFYIPEPWSYNGAICSHCHVMLQKIEMFREQVTKSFQILQSDTFNIDEIENVRKVNLEVKKTVNMFSPPLSPSAFINARWRKEEQFELFVCDEPVPNKVTGKGKQETQRKGKQVQELTVGIHENSVRSLSEPCKEGKEASIANKPCKEEREASIANELDVTDHKDYKRSVPQSSAYLPTGKEKDIKAYDKNLPDLSKDTEERKKALLLLKKLKYKAKRNYNGHENFLKSHTIEQTKRSVTNDKNKIAGGESIVRINRCPIEQMMRKNYVDEKIALQQMSKLSSKRMKSKPINLFKGKCCITTEKHSFVEMITPDQPQTIENITEYKDFEINYVKTEKESLLRIENLSENKDTEIDYAQTEIKSLQTIENIPENKDMEIDYAQTEIKSETLNEFDDDITISETYLS